MVEYATDNDQWLRKFRRGWKKVVGCGHKGMKRVPHMAAADAKSEFYSEGVLVAPLNDGNTDTAICGGVCGPFKGKRGVGDSADHIMDCQSGVMLSTK